LTSQSSISVSLQAGFCNEYAAAGQPRNYYKLKYKKQFAINILSTILPSLFASFYVAVWLCFDGIFIIAR